MYFFNKLDNWHLKKRKKKKGIIRYVKGWRKFLLIWWRYAFYILESGQWYKLFVYLSYFTCPEFSSRLRLIWEIWAWPLHKLSSMQCYKHQTWIWETSFSDVIFFGWMERLKQKRRMDIFFNKKNAVKNSKKRSD